MWLVQSHPAGIIEFRKNTLLFQIWKFLINIIARQSIGIIILVFYISMFTDLQVKRLNRLIWNLKHKLLSGQVTAVIHKKWTFSLRALDFHFWSPAPTLIKRWWYNVRNLHTSANNNCTKFQLNRMYDKAWPHQRSTHTDTFF